MAIDYPIARFNPASIRRRPLRTVQDLVPDSPRGKTAQAPRYGGPAKREVSTGIGTGAEASYPVPQVPTGVEPGESETYGEANVPVASSSERVSTPQTITEAQPAVMNQGRGARYDEGSIMGLVSSLAGTPKANEAFDPSQPIGGTNVPYKAAGLFQRFLGNQANVLNLGAQEQQAAEWKAEDTLAKQRQAKREDLEHEVGVRTEAERGLKKEERAFTAEQNKALREFQAAENALDRALRLSEGTADRTTRIELARADRDAAGARLDKELGFRASEGAADRELRKSEGAANRALDEARLGLQREGQASEIQYKQRPRFERLGDNVYTNEKGEIFEYSPGMPDLKTGKPMPGGFRKVPTPGVMAPRGAGGGGSMQVDRATGKPISAAGQLPPGGGVTAPGGTAATMGAAQPSAQPRYATLSDRLLALPGMGAIFDMPRVMTPERTARLAESRSLQEAENRERIRRMQEEAGRDIGPSMF